MIRKVLTIGGGVLGMLALAFVLVAAGWRFWPNGAVNQPGVPSAGRAGAALADEAEIWLISPTGAPVAASDVQDYLMQDRSTPNRALAVTMVALVEDLLVDGEALPDPVYLEALADIRAPLLAKRLCPILLGRLVNRCTLAAAMVERGSIDPALGTGVFRLKIDYSQTLGSDDLPDLARYFLDVRPVDLQPLADGTSITSVETALQALLGVAEAACLAEDAGQNCRILRLSLDFAFGGQVSGQAVIGSLYPLPDSLRPAPELIPAPEG